MHSSTFNSDQRYAVWGIWCFLALGALVVLCLELATRYVVPLFIPNMVRFERELGSAKKLKLRSNTNQISVLFLGNSLTETDIDVPRMMEELGPGCTLARWAVDDTGYPDWYFGLRRVFEEGGRPTLVIIGGVSDNFIASYPRRRFFARYILSPRDLPQAAASVHADATTVSSMLLAEASAFYGSREEVYKRLVTFALPDFPAFAQKLNRPVMDPRSAVDLTALAAAHFVEMKTLCEKHGARLVAWLAPIPGADRHSAEVEEAGRQAGVRVLKPVDYQSIPKERYLDGLHLDQQGAHFMTKALASRLRPIVSECQPSSTLPLDRP